MKIPFNRPYKSGNEIVYMEEAITRGHLSGNGFFTKKCQSFFEDSWKMNKCLLTTSCTDALEMCALLLDIKKGDEVILPTYTFVSTALAFVRQGATLVFVDSRSDHPGMDEDQIENLITDKTRVIVPVHYAGVACDMNKIMDIATRHNLIVIEEAAQAVDSYFGDRALGSIGHLATFSFHETKNIQCGEGGMLVVNDSNYAERAEIIWEKGTNRAQFFRGEINKYSWVDIGSSFLPSDILAAFLFAQLENLGEIQRRRTSIWNWYYENIDYLLQGFEFEKPTLPSYSSNNAHMFYVICKSPEERIRLISYLKERGIHAVFHYLALHNSPFCRKAKIGPYHLPNSLRYQDQLVRFPIYYELDTRMLFELLS